MYEQTKSDTEIFIERDHEFFLQPTKISIANSSVTGKLDFPDISASNTWAVNLSGGHFRVWQFMIKISSFNKNWNFKQNKSNFTSFLFLFTCILKWDHGNVYRTVPSFDNNNNVMLFLGAFQHDTPFHYIYNHWFWFCCIPAVYLLWGCVINNFRFWKLNVECITITNHT